MGHVEDSIVPSPILMFLCSSVHCWSICGIREGRVSRPAADVHVGLRRSIPEQPDLEVRRGRGRPPHDLEPNSGSKGPAQAGGLPHLLHPGLLAMSSEP